MTTEAEEEQQWRRKWEKHARRERWLWRVSPDVCPLCGERIGHWGGSWLNGVVLRERCEQIPDNVPLEEVRPNCYMVRCWWIGDDIRAAVDKGIKRGA